MCVLQSFYHYIDFLKLNSVKFSACFSTALLLGIQSALPSDQKTWSVMMFIFVGFASGATSGGPDVNHMDLSPRYSGIIMAITNSCGAGFSLIGPLIVQILVTNEVGVQV